MNGITPLGRFSGDLSIGPERVLWTAASLSLEIDELTPIFIFSPFGTSFLLPQNIGPLPKMAVESAMPVLLRASSGRPSSRGSVLHTYPVTLGESGNTAEDSDYQAKALEAAAEGRLVPDAEPGTLTARMHTSRRGQMAPYGDEVQKNSETKLGLEQAVRERAYLLWEKG
ncbi:hypothetical protein AWB67_06621 [Caballeronia terrestris]|uniref:Uncharacterized protein n=1 Tax=Caballeronia terrestris TaxID=1226301 RepID=A0A158KT03_9BURK|nr:hypothetical protein AWB67_06621 [Caballeronia terrestris]